VDNKRVLVDVERGRTVPNWHLRILGGVLRSIRIGGEDATRKHSSGYIKQ
jgi:U1 small nuclear ribonucleoprotein